MKMGFPWILVFFGYCKYRVQGLLGCIQRWVFLWRLNLGVIWSNLKMGSSWVVELNLKMGFFPDFGVLRGRNFAFLPL